MLQYVKNTHLIISNNIKHNKKFYTQYFLLFGEVSSFKNILHRSQNIVFCVICQKSAKTVKLRQNKYELYLVF